MRPPQEGQWRASGRKAALGGLRHRPGHFTEDRRRVTEALNVAYDQLLATRAAASGQVRRVRRLIGLLNQTHQIAEATTALAVQGSRPPAAMADAVEPLAAAIETGTAPPEIPPAWDGSPAAVSLTDALNRAAAIVAGRPDAPPGQPLDRPGWAQRLGRATAEIRAGRVFRIFAGPADGLRGGGRGDDRGPAAGPGPSPRCRRC